MPESIAVSAFGTFLKLGDGASPEVFTTIAEVSSISGPSLTLETIDVSTHSSGDPWRQFIGGLLDAGEVSFDINFVPKTPTHAFSTGLLRDMTNRTRRNFRLHFPDSYSTIWYLSGLITSFECSEAIDDVIKASITLKLTGKPLLT